MKVYLMPTLKRCILVDLCVLYVMHYSFGSGERSCRNVLYYYYNYIYYNKNKRNKYILILRANFWQEIGVHKVAVVPNMVLVYFSL